MVWIVWAKTTNEDGHQDGNDTFYGQWEERSDAIKWMDSQPDEMFNVEPPSILDDVQVVYVNAVEVGGTIERVN